MAILFFFFSPFPLSLSFCKQWEMKVFVEDQMLFMVLQSINKREISKHVLSVFADEETTLVRRSVLPCDQWCHCWDLPAFFFFFLVAVLFQSAEEKVLWGRSIYSYSCSHGTILIPPLILELFDLILLISLRILLLDLLVLIPSQILFLDLLSLIPLLIPLLSSGCRSVLCKHIFESGTWKLAADLCECAFLACFWLKAENYKMLLMSL